MFSCCSSPHNVDSDVRSAPPLPSRSPTAMTSSSSRTSHVAAQKGITPRMSTKSTSRPPTPAPRSSFSPISGAGGDAFPTSIIFHPPNSPYRATRPLNVDVITTTTQGIILKGAHIPSSTPTILPERSTASLSSSKSTPRIKTPSKKPTRIVPTPSSVPAKRPTESKSPVTRPKSPVATPTTSHKPKEKFAEYVDADFEPIPKAAIELIYKFRASHVQNGDLEIWKDVIAKAKPKDKKYSYTLVLDNGQLKFHVKKKKTMKT